MGHEHVQIISSDIDLIILIEARVYPKVFYLFKYGQFSLNPHKPNKLCDRNHPPVPILVFLLVVKSFLEVFLNGSHP